MLNCTVFFNLFYKVASNKVIQWAPIRENTKLSYHIEDVLERIYWVETREFGEEMVSHNTIKSLQEYLIYDIDKRKAF